MARKPWPHCDVPGLTTIKGERWAKVPGLPEYVVSTEGRAVRLPHTVTSKNRYGRTHLRRHPGILCTIFEDRPRIGHVARKRVDLGRAVLAAFVRDPEPGELAIRLNAVAWDCRLVNLVWSHDRRRELIRRFLDNDRGCLDAHTMDHAADLLQVSRQTLTAAMTAERRRLGRKANYAHSLRKIAETLR